MWNSPSVRHLVESVNDTMLGKGACTEAGRREGKRMA